MSYSVFLSSTQKDLKPFREAVSRALKLERHEVVEMEHFGARSEVPLEFCLQKVVNAELFVGIYAHRYGFIPPNADGISITEHEYLEARRAHRPCYCFCVAEDAEWPAELCEPEAAAALKRFKDQVQLDRGVGWFRAPEELADMVVAALRQHEKEDSGAAGRSERAWKLYEYVQNLINEWLLDKVSNRLDIRHEDCPRAGDKLEGEALPKESGAHPEVVVPLRDTFRSKNCQLLILGRSGAGKTTSLLELCQSLLQKADRNPKAQIPVILNLGSWRWHDLSFATWVKREIESKYQIGNKRAAELVKEEEVLPLLDGLDEVDPKFCAACVDKIRSFLDSRDKLKEVAVCCQSRAYDELLERLHLNDPVALLPLTRQQIDAHLAAAGPELAALREALAADEERLKLADTPLMLTLLERTCRGADAGAVRALLDSPAAVFEGYVTHMLHPERDLPRKWQQENEKESWLFRLLKRRSYPPEETRRRLAWLAQRMRKTDRELLPERLQPSWLPTAGHRLSYAALSRTLAGLLLIAPLARIVESEVLLDFGLLAGALAGALEAPRLRESSALGQEDRTLVQSVGLALRRALLIGAGVFLLYLVLGWIWQELSGEGVPLDLPRFGAFFGTLFGLTLGTRGAGRDSSNDVRIRVRLQMGRWSSRGTLWGAVSLFVLSLAFCALSPGVRYVPVLWVAIAVVATLIGAFGGGALGALEETPVPRSTGPNRGIRWTLFNAGLVGLTVAAVLALTLGALLAVLKLMGGRIHVHDWRTVFEAAATVGLWAGLWYSGLDFVQHWTLRLLLYAAGLLPLRLIHFLSYLTGRGLMQRSGGRYSFESSKLLDHFAESSP